MIELASAFLQNHGWMIVLNGNTDGSENSTEDDLGLGLRRAQAVAKALEQAGVSPTAIYTKDLGQTAAGSQQVPGVADPENRRVDLIPIGMWSESTRKAIRDCKDWIRTSCFGFLTTGQDMACGKALDLLVPTGRPKPQ